MTELRLDWCSFEHAKYAIEKWHYSKVMPTGKLVRVGVWEDGHFVGVILFGRGASAPLYKSWELAQTELCELVRVALTSHRTEVTRMMSIAIKMLRKHCPGIRMIVSFADPREGHHGGIYQGGNWTYYGQGNKTQCFFYNDKWNHTRSAVLKYGWPIPPEIPSKWMVGKHSYCYPLDDECRQKAKARQKPFPRQKQRGSLHQAHQSGEGGPIPTLSLKSIVRAVRRSLSNDLLRPKYRKLVESGAHPLTGHCYVATEAIYHLAGGRTSGLQPIHIVHEGGPHWALKDAKGAVLDATVNQFRSDPQYSLAKARTFLTREPSKRAVIVIRRAQRLLQRESGSDAAT